MTCWLKCNRLSESLSSMEALVGWTTIRCSGSKWQIDRAMRWNVLHPGIQVATLLGALPGSGIFCKLCRGADHIVSHCALAYLQEPASYTLPSANLGTHVTSLKPRSQPKKHLESALSVCILWNRGSCIFSQLMTLSTNILNLSPAVYCTRLCPGTC